MGAKVPAWRISSLPCRASSSEAAKVAAEPALRLEARGRGWAVVVWAAQRAAEAPAREATTAAAGVGWVLGR